jgi:MFS family permease
MSTQVAMVAMSRWFQATRGRALSVATLGTAFGNATLPLIFVSLMAYFSWRQLWVFAAVLAVILVPLLLWLLREERTPQSMSKSNASAGMNGVHWTRKEMFNHWLFWLCAPLIIGPPTWATVLFFQQVPLANSKGWDLIDFVGLFPWLTLGSISCTFLAGIAVDRWGAGRLLPLIPIPFAIGFLILAPAQSLFVAGVGLVLVGSGMGIQGTIVNAFWAEHFGTKNIGAIKSAAMAIVVFGSAIGPGLSGVLLDKGIAMSTQLVFYAVYFVCSAGIALIGTRKAHPLLTKAS